MKDPLDDVFSKEGKWIQVYLGIEAIQDPFEKNIISTNFNPIPVKALVADFTTAKAQWAMPGIKVSQIKEIYVQKKYRSLLEKSQKIEIRNSDKINESFEGWRENGKMQIREEGEYLRVYVYSKST